MADIQNILDYTNKYTRPYKKTSKVVEAKPHKEVRKLRWLDFGKIYHEDIPVFSFSPLDEIRKSLLESGHSKDEVDSVILGLSQLPEYDTSKRDKKSSR